MTSELQHTSLPAPRRAGAAAASYRWRRVILALVLCAAIMDLLDSTIINVAAPSIQADLGGGPATIQWLAAGYTLAFAVFLITGGRLGDIYGRRRLFILGAAGFTAASLACALAPTPILLIAARVVQGSFGALLIPQGLGILKAVFPREELGQAFGVFSPVMGLSAVGGPILAGALISADVLGAGWRMVFLINLPLGLAAAAGAVRFMPRDESRQNDRLDPVGAALVTVAALLIVYPLVQGRALGWPLWIFALLAGGLLVVAAFVAYERTTHRAPLIEPSLLTNRAFTGGLAVEVVFSAAVTGFLLVLSLYAQTALRFSPLHAGLTLAPLSLGIVLAAAASYALTPRFGRGVLHGGLALMIPGLLAFAATVAHYQRATTTWTLAPSTLIIGLGMGFVFGPLFGVILGGVRDHEVGSASGTLSAMQQFGGALGVATITTLFFALSDDGRGATTAMTTTSLVAAAAIAVTVLLVFLLPRDARPNAG